MVPSRPLLRPLTPGRPSSRLPSLKAEHPYLERTPTFGQRRCWCNPPPTTAREQWGTLHSQLDGEAFYHIKNNGQFLDVIMKLWFYFLNDSIPFRSTRVGMFR